jgi:large subunit ribosomal protein L16
VIIEIGEVSEEIAREAARLAIHKLPVKAKFVIQKGENYG